jgi:hypothetical protein
LMAGSDDEYLFHDWDIWVLCYDKNILVGGDSG